MLLKLSSVFYPLCFESKMCEIGFLCPKSVKETEKRRAKGQKTGLGAERKDLAFRFFLLSLSCCLC